MEMKVGIIGMSNLCLMPYLFTYTDFLQKKQIKFEVIYWNRKNLSETCEFSCYEFQSPMQDFSLKIGKLKDILTYIRFVKKRIKMANYDFVIILTSLPAVLLQGFLHKHYRKKYLVDIRDYTYEHIYFYKKLFQKVLANSALNVISSPGFIEFLPLKQAVLCHNLSFSKEGNRFVRKNQQRNRIPLRISYVGFIAYYDQCLSFINVIANDARFEFHFYGLGEFNSALKKYCLDNHIANVFFHGHYNPEEKENIYGNTDIIFNVYGNGTNLFKYALSNKFYEAAWYDIPILVSDGTDMRNLSKSLSFPVDCSAFGAADKIYQWYNTIDWQVLANDAQAIMNEALRDNEAFYKALDQLFEYMGNFSNYIQKAIQKE